jgi:site-specific recombinase XerD
METKKLDELIQLYIDYIDLKEITKESYRRILNTYSYYLKQHVKDRDPTRFDVLAYKEDLKARVHSATIQKHVVVIRNFYRWVSYSGLGLNIADGVHGVKIEPTFKRESLSEDEAIRLLDEARSHAEESIEGKRNYALVALLLTTGLRTIEIEKSDVADLSVLNEVNVLYIQGKGHDSKDAYVKLSHEVYQAIEDYLIERSDDFAPLFLNHAARSSGTRLMTRTVREVVKDMMRMIGLDSRVYSAHSLRHTCATLNLLHGGSLEETKQMLRHKDISTTVIYSHHIARAKNNSEIRVSDILFEQNHSDN